MIPLTVAFLDPLRLELHDTDAKIRAILLEPFRFSVTTTSRLVRVVTVPAGFETDLASIPRPVWWLPGFSPFGRIEEPSVAHDYLYSTKFPGTAAAQIPGHGDILSMPYTVTRPLADAILSAGMAAKGENLVVRGLVYGAVRLGGASHWRTAA
jgi:hypothetical protein